MLACAFRLDDGPACAVGAGVGTDFLDGDRLEAECEGGAVRREAVVVLLRREEFRIGDDAVLITKFPMRAGIFLGGRTSSQAGRSGWLRRSSDSTAGGMRTSEKSCRSRPARPIFNSAVSGEVSLTTSMDQRA